MMTIWQVCYGLAVISFIACMVSLAVAFRSEGMRYTFVAQGFVLLMVVFSSAGSVALLASTGDDLPTDTTSETYPGALQGTPAAVMAYCSDMNREPGGYFADCVAWLKVMREIEAGR